MVFNTATVAVAIAPAVLETSVSHYIHRKPLRQKPTAHITYHAGLTLIREFLIYASHHTVDDIQSFTSQGVPNPRWVRVEDFEIPKSFLDDSAAKLQKQLGPEGLERVGGNNWWQWRRDNSPLRAEWVEMRKDYNDRQRSKQPCNRSMLYVHGGAYYFGSVDEHRYQIQRHARKLQARVLAPRYRLAPQYPFPCGLHDCLAAYLYLLTVQGPETIILAGDSAGGGMILSILVILRDQGVPLPAGAVLLSPWVDLTHSFPSVAQPTNLDYIPAHGFLHRPSLTWPPPNSDDLKILDDIVTGDGGKATKTVTDVRKEAAALKHTNTEEEEQAATQGFSVEGQPLQHKTTHHIPGRGENLSITLEGKKVEIKDQIQIYATNQQLSHPLVSPVLQPTLGGLPPLLIQVGGGEMLRDEQIYIAHKAANPAKYPPPSHVQPSGDLTVEQLIKKYPPTNVQLQVWDDLCHVAPTLSFTRPAKLMYRSVAQFGAWALARAQKAEISILDDDEVSYISSASSQSSRDSTSSGTSSGTSDASNHHRGGRGGRGRGRGGRGRGGRGRGSSHSSHSSRSSHSSPERPRSRAQKETTTTDGAAVPSNGATTSAGTADASKAASNQHKSVGKAGDPLPPFVSHMIRQRVSRHGEVFTLAAEEDLPACIMSVGDIGTIKPGPVQHWMWAQREWGSKYSKLKRKNQEKRIKELQKPNKKGKDGGMRKWIEMGERPPPTAWAGRKPETLPKQRHKISRGLALWSGWGSRHDESTMEREEEKERGAERGKEEAPEEAEISAKGKEGELGNEERRVDESTTAAPAKLKPRSKSRPKSRSRTKSVVDRGQTGPEDGKPELPSKATMSGALAATAGTAAVGSAIAADNEESTVEGIGSEQVPQRRPTIAEKSTTRPAFGELAAPFKLRRDLQDEEMNASTLTLDNHSGIMRDSDQRSFAPSEATGTKEAARSSTPSLVPATNDAVHVDSKRNTVIHRDESPILAAATKSPETSETPVAAPVVRDTPAPAETVDSKADESPVVPVIVSTVVPDVTHEEQTATPVKEKSTPAIEEAILVQEKTTPTKEEPILPRATTPTKEEQPILVKETTPTKEEPILTKEITPTKDTTPTKPITTPTKLVIANETTPPTKTEQIEDVTTPTKATASSDSESRTEGLSSAGVLGTIGVGTAVTTLYPGLVETHESEQRMSMAFTEPPTPKQTQDAEYERQVSEALDEDIGNVGDADLFGPSTDNSKAPSLYEDSRSTAPTITDDDLTPTGNTFVQAGEYFGEGTSRVERPPLQRYVTADEEADDH